MRVLPALLAFLLLLPTVSAAITLEIQDLQVAYPPFDPLTGNVLIVFDDLVPQSSNLRAYISDEFQSSVNMNDYVGSPEDYPLKTHQFEYNLTSSGINSWYTYPDEEFSYTITISGTCGGEYCFVGDPPTDLCAAEGPNQCPCDTLGDYPCDWESDEYTYSGELNGGDGLKLIRDISLSFSPPTYNNEEDTVWSVTDTNAVVDTVMQKACGSQVYDGNLATSNGWIIRTIQKSELQDIPGTSNKNLTILPFNEDSLEPPDNTLFNPSGPGGIYKEIYEDYIYQSSPGQVEYNGPAGNVIIKHYDDQATYFMAYLPPNGEKLCAFTASKDTESQQWSVGTIYPAQTKYTPHYTRTFLPADLPQPPNCPPGTEGCSQQIIQYNAYETSDPSDTVQVSFDEPLLTVTATTTDTSLSQTFTAQVPLSSFPFLHSPIEAGDHLLEINLDDFGTILASGYSNFSSCLDADNDGYCSGAGDCDDTNPNTNPEGTEACDGKDNDCDDEIDEDFRQVDNKIGNPCGVGVCAGVIVCTPDGLGTECSNSYSPGDFPEYCSDGKDNDCDGEVDETLESTGAPACVCKDGEKRDCGSSIGECVSGYRLCVNNQWGTTCEESIGPTEEVCNGKDDDCDSIIDNVGSGSSAESSSCQCYGGAFPTEEVCNDIDDDCDGQIDDGVQCCNPGDERQCGTTIGTCELGTQYCVDGSWSSCSGGTQPIQEVCYNKDDDNCNGQTDENCSPEITCFNGIKDLNEAGVDCGSACPDQCSFFVLYWIYILAAIIIAAVSVLLIQLYPE